MAENPPDANLIPLPVYRKQDGSAAEQDPTEQSKATAGHHETVGLDDSSPNLHHKAAVGVIQQQHTIPVTGDRKPTSKWEYIFYCIFCEHVRGHHKQALANAVPNRFLQQWGS